MSILNIGVTKVEVMDGDELLYQGIFCGFGIIGLGINGTEQGVIVMADFDEGKMECGLVKMENVIFIK